MIFRTFALVFALAVASLLPVSMARAECIAPGFNTSGKFCNGCRYEGTMSTSRDQVCERPYRWQAPAGTPSLEILGHRVIQRAKHGVAGINGVTMAYAPGKGFVGKDEFAVQVDYRQGSDTGKFTVHWNVTVQ
jgi:hypothetical protein